MAETNKPNANHSSGVLTDTEYEQLVAPYTTSAVIGKPGDSSLIYADSSGRQIKVRAGKFALVRGQLFDSGGSDTTVAVTANSSGQTRNDLVVLQFDRSALTVRVVVKAGTPGSGPPTPTVNTGTTGVYEIALATIKVINGAATIAATDVTQVAYYLGAQPILCTESTKPPHSAGLRIYCTDTGVEYTSTGSVWKTASNDTGWINLVGVAGWDLSGSYIRNKNGITYVKLVMVRTGGAVSSGLNVVCTVNSIYWPSNIGDPPRFLGYFADAADKVDDPKHDITDTSNGGIVAEGYMNPSGNITVYSLTTIRTGDVLRYAVAAFPAG